MEQIQYDIRPGEYADAMRTTQSARLLFWLAIGVMLIFQLAVFGLVEAGGVVDEEGLAKAPAAEPTEAPDSPSAGHPDESPAAPAGTPTAAAKAGHPDAADAKGADAKAREAKAAEGKTAPPKGAEAKGAEAKVAEGKAAEGKAGKATPPNAKSAGAKTPPAEAKTPAIEPKTPPAELKTPPAEAKAPTAGKGSAATTAPRKTAPAPTRTEKWQLALRWLLPAAKFIAAISAMLLSLTIFLAVLLSLTGRLGGMSGLIGSFFWSLVLLAMVIPWQQVLVRGTMACGALYNFGELMTARAEWIGSEMSAADAALYYGRFVGYPAVALLAWLVVQVRFARACAVLRFPHSLPSPVAVVAAAAAAAAGERPAVVAAPPASAERSLIPDVGPQRSMLGKSLAQRALDEKSQAGTGRPKPEPPVESRPAGALTERIIRHQTGTQPDQKDA